MSSQADSVESSSPAEDLVVRAVMRLARRLRRAAPAAELTAGALALLLHLHRDGPASAVALARAEGLQPQSLSRVLARMTGDGLIARAVDPEDRRRHVIAITDRGRGALSWAMTERRRWMSEAMRERLSADERDALTAAAAIMLKLST